MPKDPKAVSVKQLMDKHKLGQKKKAIVPGKDLYDNQKKTSQPTTKPYVRGNDTVELTGAHVEA